MNATNIGGIGTLQICCCQSISSSFFEAINSSSFQSVNSSCVQSINSSHGIWGTTWIYQLSKLSICQFFACVQSISSSSFCETKVLRAIPFPCFTMPKAMKAMKAMKHAKQAAASSAPKPTKAKRNQSQAACKVKASILICGETHFEPDRIK